MATPAKTYAKKFNAQRAAKAVGYSSGDVEIVKTRDCFTFRVKGGTPAEKGAQATKAERPSRKARKSRKVGVTRSCYCRLRARRPNGSSRRASLR